MAKDCTNVAITKAFLLGGCHPSAQTLGSRKKEAGSQCLGTGMTGKEGYLDDIIGALA
ncbi:hypothetical protein [Wolbachia endosymbiont (group A) of Agelastica alni]|uniref:hypothetical protein n=1 Tax=Wolbachia endosymbiont (group A) of Agelastica alni TaxID=3066130 RepID=UPI003342704A